MATKKSIRKIPVSDAGEKPVKSRKAVAKKAERLSLDTFTVSQAELAAILGIATSNVTPMVQAGLMVKDSDGRFNLRDSVSGYCKRMRERKGGLASPGSKSELDVETARWKLENIKAKNRDWRMQRDREVALEIIRSLTTAMTDFREQAKMNPGLVDAIDELLGRIGSVNVDSVSIAVEGEVDDDDDE